MPDHTTRQSPEVNIEPGYCHCGCGQLAPIHKKTRSNQGHVRGEPAQYIRGHNARLVAAPGLKVCSKCVEMKPLEEFYPSKGRRSSTYCIQCTRDVARAYLAANREKQYARGANYRRDNKERLAERERERRADPTYREKCALEIKEWRDRNREHVAAYNRSLPVKARAAVNKAVQRGKLPPPDTMVCDSCDEALAAHYHHFNGYEREHWFDIEPLCTECHGREHRVS